MKNVFIERRHTPEGALAKICLYTVTGPYTYDAIEVFYLRDGSVKEITIRSMGGSAENIRTKEEADKGEIGEVTGDVAAYYERIRINLLNAEAGE